MAIYDESEFIKIFQGKNFYIRKDRSERVYSYWYITQDQGAAQQTIGILLEQEDVDEIIASGGDPETVRQIIAGKPGGMILIRPSRPSRPSRQE